MPSPQAGPLNQPSATPSPPKSTIPGWTILPLRFFLGVSFLVAGWDKLTDPAFLDPSATGYIGDQIAQFAPGTPLEGFLLNFAVPNATLFGLLVMGGELCIGIAVLLGLLTRFSAAMGLLLNLTFFLSATWEVRPFYFGADLPYVFAWLTLVLAGPGPFALDAMVKQWLSPPPIVVQGKHGMMTVEDGGTAMTRRAFLGASAVGLTGVMLAATGITWGIINSGKRRSTVAAAQATPVPPTQALSIAPTPVPQDTWQETPQEQPTTSPTEQPTPAPAEPTPAPSNNAQLIAGPNEVPLNQSLDFILPSGEPAVLVHNDSGYSAYVAICTHEGCQIAYSKARKVLACPCHGAQFNATNGQVVRGPARRPLSPVAVTVEPDGSVYLAE